MDIQVCHCLPKNTLSNLSEAAKRVNKLIKLIYFYFLGDPVTKKFLQENIDQVFGFPRLVRYSWATAYNVLLSKALQVEFEDESEVAKPKTAKGISNFFKGDKPQARPRHIFFRDRCLDNTFDL